MAADAIVPILGIVEPPEIFKFLGTGSFVGSPPRLVTADHVVRDWKGPLAIVILPDTDHPLPAHIIARHPAIDVALLEVPGFIPPRVLQPAEDRELAHNVPVICFEYGTTRTEEGQIFLHPATRMGNVTRILDLTHRYGEAGRSALELSFPALLGASGAPVVSNTTFRLWGMVIANVGYHLLPAQIESIVDEQGRVTEETRFLLPQAVAVHVKHIRKVL